MSILWFARYRDLADPQKESYLSEIACGASDGQALERVNRAHEAELTMATVRGWIRSDQDFADALVGARSGYGGPPRCWNSNALTEPAQFGYDQPWAETNWKVWPR